MARTIAGSILLEEIQSVTHEYPRDGHSGTIQCYIGKGTESDGVFVFAVPQSFEHISIADADYNNLGLIKFNREDLWSIIDTIRARYAA